MKNILILIPLLFSNLIHCQVLYEETFDNYTLGNLGTDYSGVIPGQGGWLTDIQFFQGVKNNSFSTIANETGKGKVLAISGPVPVTAFNMYVTKTGLDNEIDQRTAGNNVIKLEFDFFTGSEQPNIKNTGRNYIFLGYVLPITHSNAVVKYRYFPKTGAIGVDHYGNNKPVILNNAQTEPVLPFNTWVTFRVYLDYTNKKVYYETPYFNAVAVGDFLANSTSTNLIEDFKPSVFQYFFSVPQDAGPQQMVNKLDNIKITALQSVPPNVLSDANFLTEKFNIYPNPANNVVTITNNENMLVKEVAVYDITGKLINTQNYNNETEIQLNVEHLASGTYILHLQTNEGTAVKKLVRK